MRAGRSLISWSLYDWASSPVPTLHATFIFSVYFTTAVMPDGGTAAWAWMTSATAFLVAVAAPVLGRLADRHGWLKACLGTVTLIGAATTAGLWFVRPDPHYAILALGLSAASIFAMEIAFVFYNALLPAVASEQEYGRASGLAWGLGYVGAIIALGLCCFCSFFLKRQRSASARVTRRIYASPCVSPRYGLSSSRCRCSCLSASHPPETTPRHSSPACGKALVLPSRSPTWRAFFWRGCCSPTGL